MCNERNGGLLLAKVHQLAGRIFQKKLKKYNLDQINPAQGRILFCLKQEDGIAIQELGKRTSLSKSTLTSMLDRLEADGFLKRIPAPDDRRKFLVKLSERMAEIEEGYRFVSEEMVDLFYRGFSDEEINRFEEDLNRIFQNLNHFEMEEETRNED